MQNIEILAIIAFFGLLAASIFMLLSFYVCDGLDCKPFNEAAEAGPSGSQPYVLSLLNEFANDGMWPLPYIGSAIATPLCLWFLQFPITVLTFAIMFFVIFVVIYFMFSFYNHHYVRFISDYTANYIRTNGITEATTEAIASNSRIASMVCENLEPPKEPPDEPTDEPPINNPPLEEDPENYPGITFLPPVNVF